MKKFSYAVVLLTMALTMASCGNKNSSGGASGNVNLNSYSTQSVSGYVDLNSPFVFVSSNGQFSFQQNLAMDNAFQIARNNGTIVQGISRYRVVIQGIFSSGYNNGYQGGFQGGFQGGYNNGMTSGSVQISSAVFSRL